MSSKAQAIEIGEMPELARLAREVAKSGEPCVLHDHGAEIAVVSPIHPTGRGRNQTSGPEAIAAALAAAGGWKDLVDTEQLKADIQADRGSQRPPVRL